MKIKKDRLFVVLLCLITAFALFSVQVLAAVPIDSERECSLEITFNPEGIGASGVKFDAYKVASVTASYEFKIEPQFLGQGIEKLLQNPDSESYNLIASTLTGVIASDSTIKPDDTAITNSAGIAHLDKLKIGLYLIVGEVYQGTEAYYTPQNFLVSFPERLSNDLWNYDISSNVKWEKRLKNDPVNLEVLKVWSDSATNLHTNDTVTVELYKDGELYDTQILSKDNSFNYKWNNLYGGSSFAVKEKEIKGYTATVERKDDCFVITNTPEKETVMPDIIPQTGLLWWPVPMLTVGGVLFIIIGIFIKRKGEK